MSKLIVRFVLSVGLALCVAQPAAAASVDVGPIHPFIHVPYPGNPGGLAVDGNTLWVDTSAASFDRPFDAFSNVFAYDLGTGRLADRTPNPFVIPKNPVALMGLAGIALDASGRQYIADMNGQVLRLDPGNGKLEVYGTIPTNTQTSLTDMPVFDAFGPDGSLYVGEGAGSPVIWRVPPGGGEAQAWFADPQLLGGWAGSVLGLAVDPTGKYLYFAAGNQQPRIVVLRLPLAHPDSAHLETFHTYSDLVLSPCPVDPANAGDPNAPLILTNCEGAQAVGAGGIAFGKSGRLYVALFAKNQLSILSAGGDELARFPDSDENMMLEVPVNGPLGLAFDRRGNLLVANAGDPSSSYLPGGNEPPGGLPDSKSWAVLSVPVHDSAARLFRPAIR